MRGVNDSYQFHVLTVDQTTNDEHHTNHGLLFWPLRQLSFQQQAHCSLTEEYSLPDTAPPSMNL